jgi:hypothetical protein
VRTASSKAANVANPTAKRYLHDRTPGEGFKWSYISASTHLGAVVASDAAVRRSGQLTDCVTLGDQAAA